MNDKELQTKIAQCEHDIQALQENKNDLEQQLEKDTETYSVKDWFIDKDGRYFALCAVDGQVVLMCFRTKNWWFSNPLYVDEINHITKDEFNRLCAGRADQFTRVERPF